MSNFFASTPIISTDVLCTQPVQVDLKRLDLIHPYISGNKFFKLKYNILQAKNLNYQGLLSFGGAYSNHILALAYAGWMLEMPTIAIIRGEELADRPLNPILKQAQDWGMKFIFASRKMYNLRYNHDYLSHLAQEYSHYFILPEGACNEFAQQGCSEILSDYDITFYDYICCAVGTGGTITGLIERSQPHQKILGFSALKGHFLTPEIQKHTTKQNWQILDDYCFGGYAKYSLNLVHFIHQFKQDFNIDLEAIYTAKMMYGIFDLIKNDYFPINSKILAIHTGGVMAGQYLIKDNL